MTYYEEFGVESSASVEEIREAYKRLVRLLHPDTQKDPKQRHVAECQMKRLNGVCETLTHPERRRHYDHSISAPPSADRPSQPVPTRLRYATSGWMKGAAGVWAGAVVMGALLISFTLMDGGGAARNVTPVAEASTGKPAIAYPAQPPTHARTGQQLQLQIVELRHRLEEMRTERDTALRQILSLEQRVRSLAPKAEPMTTAPLLMVGSVPLNLPFTIGIEPAQPQSLAGSWYYARRPQGTPGRNLYPPENIEAFITEDGGDLQGRYSARFRVTDRAISPEVMFQFRGKAGTESAKLAFSGAGGARGEVRLKLLTPNTLEVAWIAHELGNTIGLGSATAVLTRRDDP